MVDTGRRLTLYMAHSVERRAIRNRERARLAAFGSQKPYADLVGQLRERETLSRFFDPAVAEMLEDRTRIAPKRRKVTVVFWDISGFTDFALHENSLELVTSFLSGFFERAVDAVFRHNGIVDKFIGDGVMALFGVDLTARYDSTEHATRAGAQDALRATNALQRSFLEWHGQWLEARRSESPYGLPPIGLTAGLATAEGIVGDIGPPSRVDFSVIGPVANLAARLQGKAASWEVVMCSVTAAQAGVSGRSEYYTDLKGIPQGVSAIRIEAPELFHHGHQGPSGTYVAATTHLVKASSSRHKTEEPQVADVIVVGCPFGHRQGVVSEVLGSTVHLDLRGS